jgi:heme-degrading monooxygenase HmoA
MATNVAIVFVALLGVVTTAIDHPVYAQKASDLHGSWSGSLTAMDQNFDLFVDFNSEDDHMQGFLSLPAQNLQRLPLKVQLSGDKVSFVGMKEGKESPAKWEGTLNEARSVITGTLTQQGNTFTFTLSKGKANGAPAMDRANEELIAVAMYTIKPDKLAGFPAAKKRMYSVLTKHDGYLTGEVFESEEDERQFAGYYTYASMDHAMKASQVFPTQKETADYLNSVDQFLMYDRSYLLAENSHGDLQKTKLGNHVTLKIYEVNKEHTDTFAKKYQNVITRTRGLKGLRFVRTSRSAMNSSRIIEFSVWETKEAAQAAQKEIQDFPAAKELTKYATVASSGSFKTRTWE